MPPSKVSVIIPNYNYSHYLREAIDSVFGQTYGEIEVIVVDDGSSDDSKTVLETYGEKIRCIFQRNQGVAAARNNGVAESTGGYLAFLDADDSWLPTKIEKQVERFASDEALGLVHVGVREVDREGNALRERLDGVEGNVAEKLLMLKHEGILGGGSGFMVPREVFDEVGGFDTQLSTSADWDLFYQVSSRYPVGFVPEILLNYRYHDANMRGNVALMEHDMMLAFEKAFSKAAPETAKLRRRAYGALHHNLAGSYFAAADYKAFVIHSMKSLAFSPRNIAHFVTSGRRRIGGGGPDE